MIRTPFDILADYERRSLAHAVALPQARAEEDQWRGVAYRIGSRRLVSSFDEVVEIVPIPPVTPVPGAQPWMLGVGNLRGNLFPVIDLKQFLQGERTGRILLVEQGAPEVRFCDQDNKGYLLLTLDHAAARAEFKAVSKVLAKPYDLRTVARWQATASGRERMSVV